MDNNHPPQQQSSSPPAPANSPQTASQTLQSPTPPPSTPSAKNMYPEITFPYNEHPNRLLAFPLFAYLIKAIIMFPQAFILMFLGVFIFILWFINPFVILFTGKCWDTAYKFTFIYLRFYTKIYLYLFGLTDKYPGFSSDENGIFTFKYDKPATSSRLLGFPILGVLIRFIILIPFSVYTSIVQMGAVIAVFCSWFVVLLTGRYPESFYEFIKDYLRLWNASFMYSFYLSDTYPSFRISMNHKAVKIILLILGFLLVFGDYYISATKPHTPPKTYNYTSPAPSYNP